MAQKMRVILPVLACMFTRNVLQLLHQQKYIFCARKWASESDIALSRTYREIGVSRENTVYATKSVVLKKYALIL